MNSFIIPQGPTERVTGPATINRPVLLAEAVDGCLINDIVDTFPATPPNAAQTTTAIGIVATGKLYNIKSMTLMSGTLNLIYRR